MKKLSLLISALLLSVSMMAQTYSTTGLTGYYKFENPNNLGAATVGSNLEVSSTAWVTPIADRNGTANSAVALGGGTSSYLNSQFSPSASFRKGSVSLATWVYIPNFNTASTYHTVAGVRYNATSSPYNSYLLAVQKSNQKVVFSYNNTGGVNVTLTSITALSANTWYHVAATYDSASHTATIYVNGTSEGIRTDGTGALKYNVGNPEFVVGNVVGAGGNSFVGRMDELFVYSRALTAVEVAKLYNECPITVKLANKGFAGKEALVLSSQTTPVKFKFSKGSNAVFHTQTAGDTLKLAQLTSLKKGAIYKYTVTNADSCKKYGRVAIRPTIPTTDLATYLSLADYGYGSNWGDSTGNGFHFNNTGATPAAGVSGVDSSAAYFNASSYLTSANNLPPNTSMSTAGWIKVMASESPNAYPTIFNVRHGENTPYNSFWVGALPSGKVQFIFSNTTVNDVVLTSNTSIQAGTWVHIAAVYDQTSGGKLYINGVLDNSLASTGNLVYNNRKIYIGGNGIDNHYFRGNIDEVLVYNRAITAAEVSQIYGNFGVVGIKNNMPSYKALALYPSPSQRNITVSAIEKGVLNIYSVEGKQMIQTAVNQGENTLNVADLPAGMYVATVVSKDAVQRTQFVKE
ncbi:Por secretion system C-terminal sorting domain-containing protein [Flexibacter flexilis DSM 6793]|uniref:Por secretion system C-terminal sorting domain-containing protein n=1 Tax=Flexibacter flexilis DSM 6793 TaxID=927664 RepID=A0A1I1FI40_9BACT|nr:LamG-like jellyroll fold domain-containing protein [Flexibacter flexilis]SFB99149.1 Por secretion system C-terminal sorting domain-containing protein [Flexibacter flexilis DSM 6793]